MMGQEGNMNKSYIVKDLYEVSHWDSEGYLKYKDSMCKTLLWRSHAFVWRLKYTFNLAIYKLLG